MVSGGGRITFGGLASGIDTNSIIDQLIQIERRPILLAENRRAMVEAKSNAFGQISSSFSALLTRAQTLGKVETYSQRSTSVLAKEADASKISASATPGAAVGAFTFHVTQLATQTAASSAQAIGQAIDADAPLDAAGFGAAFTPGTFSINGTMFTIAAATSEAVTSTAAVGAPFDAQVPLDSGGLDIAPVTGAFEVNGVNINYDAATDTVGDVVKYINNSAAGVTASFDVDTNTLTLTHETVGSGQTITLEDLDGNFLEAMKLIDGGGATIAAQTAGTDVVSLNDVIEEINNAGIGVTATLEDDAAARPNLLQLTSGAAVQVGTAGDTSNFLGVTSLLASPPGTTRTSQRGLGAASRTEDLSAARLATALTETVGSFKINGVEIAYDADGDSLSNIITRINNSDAGVTATYDAQGDRLKISNDDSGSLAISFEDVEGNLMSALGVLGASQTMGQNAAYSVDGGPVQYSTSNTISDAIDGVTLTVNDTTTEAVRVNVNLQTNGVLQAVDTFVKDFNATLNLMGQLTAYSEDGDDGILFGDGTVRRMEQGLRSIITRSVPDVAGGLRTLSDIGVSFGAVGAAAGTANRLALDTAKLTAAMQSDPEAVSQLLTVFSASASLVDGGAGSIASISGTPTTATKAGTYTIDSDATGNLVSTFTPLDGSAPITKTGAITAGGTNDTLIPGVTLTAHGVLAAGSNQVTINASSQGFAKMLTEYVDSLTRAGGLLAGRNDEMSNIVSDINAQIDRLEARVSSREAQLVKKFTAMEMAISQMQSQQQALTQMQAQFASIQSSRKN